MELLQMPFTSNQLLIFIVVSLIILIPLLIGLASNLSSLRKRHDKLCHAYRALEKSYEAKEEYVAALHKGNNEKSAIINELQAREDAEFNMRILLIQYISELKDILYNARLVVVYKDKVYNSFSINKDGKAVLRLRENKQNVNHILDIQYELHDNVYSKKDLQDKWNEAEDVIIGVREIPTAPTTETK